jgi:hypothetical protein
VLPTQEFIRINKSLGAGDIVTINTCNGYRDVTAVIDNVEQSYLQFLDFDSTWLQFSPGTSTVGFATSLNGVADETYKNLSITITYKTCLFNLEEE